MRPRRSHLALLATLLACLLLAPGVAAAAPFTVTDGFDAGTGGCTLDECTLREAIVAANAAAGADTIGFSDEVFTVEVASALPDVTGTATIDGGAGSVTLFGDTTAMDGLRLTGSGSTITGLAISNFGGDGVRLAGTGGHRILGSTIEDSGGHAVVVASSGNTIGGVTDEGNTVIGAGGDGVAVLSGNGNRILGNAITGAAGLGIDLAPDGPTPNDVLDADTGANDLQNFPVVTAATADDLGVAVTASLSSKASQGYTIHFYAAQGCGGSGGQYLGSAPLTTGAGGTGSTASTTVDLLPFDASGVVATATDAAGNTSEFGPLRSVGGAAVGGITPQCDPGELARAMSVDPAIVTGASWVAIPGGGPAGTATAAILGYPTHGADYAVMASGDVTRLAPGGTGQSGLGGPSVRGDSDFDVSILKVDLNVPAGRNCLSIDFRFASEEYPVYLNSSYNDAFIAELDTSNWTTAGSTITAPQNFAFDPSGDVISINSTGNTAMTHALAAGTGYYQDPDQAGATPPLRANKVITQGAHSLYLSIFDQGDTALDSAVVLDNLVLSTKTPAACASGATSDLTPPVVTLVTPADGATTTDTTPTYDGAAGTAPGDLAPVTIKIYAGTQATGTPVQTLTVNSASGAWTVDGTTALAAGTYTAQAEQSDNAGNTGVSAPHTFTVTASPPEISIGDKTVTEGNSGTVPAAFAVTLNHASAGPVSIDWAAAAGTATPPADFTLGSGTVTFAAGEVSKTVTVLVNGDFLDEADETFTVTLSNPSGGTIADGSGLGTISDDDPPPALSINDTGVLEGDVPATFTVTLNGASGKAITVQWATANGTATQPLDYGQGGGTLTFAPGETSKTVGVAVKEDTLDEADEKFTVTLSVATNASIADGTGEGTIADDDPEPSLSIGDRSLVEQNGNAGFAVTLSAASGKTVTVAYATADGTAKQPGDYTAASGTLTFAPGETSKTVDVPIKQDALDEPDEGYAVTLSTPSNATIADGTGAGTITDDDPAPALSIGDRTVTEGDAGTRTASFAVTLGAASGKEVTVGYATADGTATQPGDYASASGTLTFAPGQTSRTIDVAVHGDTDVEGAEGYTVGLADAVNATIADGSGAGTITDDDTTPSVSIGDRTVTEGDSGTVAASFTVSLSAASGKTVTVAYATADGTAKQPGDYAAQSGTVTFAPGETSKSVSVAVNGDTADEQNETFTVGLSAPVNATLADGSGTGTITDDDEAPPPPPVPAISIAGVTVSPEGDSGTKDATFAVTLSGATTVPVSVKYATADGTAKQPADYAAASGTLTFAPGETTKPVVVKVAGDTLVEPGEAFTVTLSAPIAATLGTATATGSIADDDEPVTDVPDQVPPGGLFCGRQHRGKCKGIKAKGEFGGPGNASWVFDAYNPAPGGSGKTVRLARIKRAIAGPGTVAVTCKLKGRKADKLLRKVRKAKLTTVRVTTTFTDAAGRTTTSTADVKLKKK